MLSIDCAVFDVGIPIAKCREVFVGNGGGSDASPTSARDCQSLAVDGQIG